MQNYTMQDFKDRLIFVECHGWDEIVEFLTMCEEYEILWINGNKATYDTERFRSHSKVKFLNSNPSYSKEGMLFGWPDYQLHDIREISGLPMPVVMFRELKAKYKIRLPD